MVLLSAQAKCGCSGADKDMQASALHLPPNLMQAANIARLAALQPGGTTRQLFCHLVGPSMLQSEGASLMGCSLNEDCCLSYQSSWIL